MDSITRTTISDILSNVCIQLPLLSFVLIILIMDSFVCFLLLLVCDRPSSYCAHGGSLDSNTCKCTCPPGWKGDQCLDLGKAFICYLHSSNHNHQSTDILFLLHMFCIFHPHTIVDPVNATSLPTSGGRTNITGYNFGNTASAIKVQIGGVNCTSVQIIVANTQISCVLPEGNNGSIYLSFYLSQYHHPFIAFGRL